MKFYSLLFVLLFVCTTAISQNKVKDTTNYNNLPKTIENQFNEIYKKSGTWTKFKVISKDKYKILQKNVRDSIKNFNTEIQQKNTLIESQKNDINSLKLAKKEADNKLADALKKENSMSLFGAQISKQNYATILFSTLVVLLLLLLFFIYKFKNSNALTTTAKSNLEELEGEFNAFRKKSLEREQKLRRELQDEIIKNRS